MWMLKLGDRYIRAYYSVVHFVFFKFPIISKEKRFITYNSHAMVI